MEIDCSQLDNILYEFIYEYENLSWYQEEVELAKKLREQIETWNTCQLICRT